MTTPPDAPKLLLVTSDLAEVIDGGDSPEPLAEIVVGRGADGAVTIEVTKHAAPRVRISCGAQILAVTTDEITDAEIADRDPYTADAGQHADHPPAWSDGRRNYAEIVPRDPRRAVAARAEEDNPGSIG